MPVFNAEAHVEEAVESVLSQTLPDFEFLIVDDGSTDGTKEIVLSYSDSRIRYVENPANRGLTRTLNEGLNLAKYDLIARMDADDISQPDRFRQQYRFCSENPECALVSTSVRLISERGRHLYEERIPADSLYYNLAFHCGIYHPSVMFRRTAVEAVGGYIGDCAEDYGLWCRLARRYRIGHLEKTLLDYRISDTSLSNNTRKAENLRVEKEHIYENMRYFLEGEEILPEAYVECFRNNFEALAGQSPKTIADCLTRLERISENIAAKSNPNRDPDAIKRAAKRKRRRILKQVMPALSLRSRVALCVRTGELRGVRRYVKPRWRNGSLPSAGNTKAGAR